MLNTITANLSKHLLKTGFSADITIRPELFYSNRNLTDCFSCSDAHVFITEIIIGDYDIAAFYFSETRTREDFMVSYIHGIEKIGLI